MKVLLVEDDETIVEAIQDALARGNGGIEVEAAHTMEQAITAMSTSDYDLLVCDLVIPATSGDVPALEHGNAVYRQSRDNRPGTPILLFSAYGALAFEEGVVRQEPWGDPLGSGRPREMVRFFDKNALPECVDEIRSISASITKLDSIQLQYTQVDLELDPSEKRIVRVMASRNGAALVRCGPLAGGLTGARVFDLELRAPDHTFVGRLAGKIAPVNSIQVERSQFTRHVPARLLAGSYAPFADVVSEGCGNSGGIFYRLAENYRLSLFGQLLADPPAAAEVVKWLRSALAPWIDGAAISTNTVESIRRGFVDDVRLRQRGARHLGARMWREAEARVVQARRATQHGDLHGANILVSTEHRAMLIDFARLDSYTSACDAVTLELSVFFHPEGRSLVPGGLDAARLRQWFGGAYADGTALEGFVHACRDWAREAAVADGDVAANAYSYAVRQLTYDDTDKERALAVIDSVLPVLLR